MAGQNVGQVELDLILNSKKFRTQMQGAVDDAVGKATKSMGKSAAGNALGAMGANVGKLGASMAKLGKIGLIVGAALAALKPVFDFSKEAISIGSDLQEVANVVETTFPKMSDEVDKFAKDSIMQYGLSELATKKYMGTMGAMAKSFGFTEEQAFHMSKTLTGLTGDVASFYNLSADESYNKMKAVFTGETESLKELGIVMTQAALDEFAMAQGYGKTTAAMNEQEKVALRFAFVQSKLKNVTGDFIRTQDSWANQIKILNMQWTSFKGNIGRAFINILTPVIQLINLLMTKLVQASKVFSDFIDKLFGKVKEHKDTEHALEQEAEGAEHAAGGFTNAANAAKKLRRSLLGFDQLNILQNQDEPDVGGIGGGGMGDIDIGVEPEDLEEQQQHILTGNKLFWEMFMNDIKKAVHDMVENHWNPFVKHLSESWERTCKIFKKSWKFFVEPSLKRMKKKFHELWSQHLKTLFENTIKCLGDIIDLLGILWDLCIQPILDGLAFLAPFAIMVLTEIGNMFLDFVTLCVDLCSELIKSLSGVIKFIEGVFTLNWELAWEGISEFFEGICSSFVIVFKAIFDPMEESLESFGFSFKETWTKVKKSFWDACDWIHTKWDSLTTWIGDIFEWVGDRISTIWKNIKKTASDVLGTMVSAVKAPFNGLIGLLNKFIGKLNSIHIKIPSWIPGIGGHTFGFNIGYIPYLAQGGYIGPNQPQLAMIGDNRHEGEIVAPESKLLEAVQIGNGPLLQAIQALLQLIANQGAGGAQKGQIVIPIYLDGELLDQYIADSDARRALRSGGF